MHRPDRLCTCFSSLFVLSNCDGRGVQNRPLKKRDQQNQKHQTRKCLTALSRLYIPARANNNSIRLVRDTVTRDRDRSCDSAVLLASRARLRDEVTDFRQDATERRARGGVCSVTSVRSLAREATVLRPL